MSVPNMPRSFTVIYRDKTIWVQKGNKFKFGKEPSKLEKTSQHFLKNSEQMKNHSSLKAGCLALCYHTLFDFQGQI